MRFRIPLDLLPAALGVSSRTIKRWQAAGLITVGADGAVDDLDAERVRDELAARRHSNLSRRA